MAAEPPAPSLSALRVWFGHLALAIPLLSALLSAAPGSDFRDDLAAVRSLGLVPIGTEGWVSTAAIQLASLLPVGGLWLRAAWVSAFALAVASRLLYGATLRALDPDRRMPRLAPALALAAALMATLSEGFQVEGCVVGGGAVAAALVFSGMSLLERFRPGDHRAALLWGALVGLCAAESHAAALSLTAATLVLALVRRRTPTARQIGLAAAGLFAVLLLVVAATLIRPLAPGAVLDVGSGLGQSSLTAVDTEAPRVTAFSAWLHNVGLLSFGLALLGLLAALSTPRLRVITAPWIAFVLLDWLLPNSRESVLVPDPFAATRLCALGGISLAAALGVERAVIGLERTKLPFSRSAAVMIVAFNFTLVLSSSESAAQAAERRSSIASEAWTDEALATLAPGSLLIARSEAILFRLLAAKLVRGERPDVVVVPAPLLERPGVRRRLLALEPALAPLLRELALNGKASEFALSTLSDVRPLYLELEREANQDPRRLDHIAPRAFWNRYYAHPLGNSDRRAAFEKGQEGFSRVVATLSEDPSADRGTRALLRSLLRERARFFDKVRDLDSLEKTLARLTELAPSDPLLEELRPKLEKRRLSALVPGAQPPPRSSASSAAPPPGFGSRAQNECYL